MMVDWLSVELPDPVGLPINDGHVCRLGPDGSLSWSTACRRSLEGSWSSNMTFRAVSADYAGSGDNRALWELQAASGAGPMASGLEVSGNPAKFLNGHNLFGSDDPLVLLRGVVERAAPVLWPGLNPLPDFDFASATVSRIDLTGAWLLDRAEDVVPFLRAMEERVWCPYRGRGVMNDVGTLYYGFTKKGKRAKDWQLKLYSKGLDITAHPLPAAAYGVEGLLDEVNRTIRVELTLRTAELKRLGLSRVGDWTPAKVGEIWRCYVDKLNFGDGFKLDRAVEDLASNPDLKPRHLTAIAAWKAGHDMRSLYRAKATLYRVRNEIMELTGIDVFVPVPKSNVVPLRRVVTAQPALRPHWADHLTAALDRAA